MQKSELLRPNLPGFFQPHAYISVSLDNGHADTHRFRCHSNYTDLPQCSGANTSTAPIRTGRPRPQENDCGFSHSLEFRLLWDVSYLLATHVLCNYCDKYCCPWMVPRPKPDKQGDIGLSRSFIYFSLPLRQLKWGMNHLVPSPCGSQEEKN